MALTPNGSGVQTYCEHLIGALADQVDDPSRICARVQTQSTGLIPPAVAVEVRADCAGVRRLFEGWRGAPGAGLVHGLDVDVPRHRAGPVVTTVHDLSVFDVPWTFSRWRSAAERRAVSIGIGRADAIIAVSAFTAERVAERFGREATVTHLAPAPNFTVPDDATIAEIRHRYRLPDAFVLHVGTIEPRKDVAALAAACRRLGAPLVLAGARAGDLPHDPGLQWLGYVPRDDLAGLYGAAHVVAYPSRYEGFGLPPIEAMASGAVVVATAVGALPELAAQHATVHRGERIELALAAPGDPDALEEHLAAAIGDEAQRCRRRATGAAIVDALSWSHTARRTLGVYEELGVSL